MGILDKFKKMFSFGKKKGEKREEVKVVRDEDIVISEEGVSVAVREEGTPQAVKKKEEKREIEEVVESATQTITPDTTLVSQEDIASEEILKNTFSEEEVYEEGVLEKPKEEEKLSSTKEEVEAEEVVEVEVEEEEHRGEKVAEETSGALVDFATIQVMDEDERDELMAFLIKADFGVMLADELLDIIEQYPPEERTMKLRQLLATYLPPKPEPLKVADVPPTVYYFFGVNGVGKTTTIAKFAHVLKNKGKVLLIGADTFRAAATDQLGLWAERVGVDAHLGERGADPSSVIYTGVEKAKARGYDFVLVDTAGRMSTKKNLIAELQKMERVVKKIVPDAPHESFLVLDATQGQAAFRQAKTFMEAVQVSRIILTKLDSTAKGGFIFSIWKELGIPIAFLSFGQELDDWVEYSPSVILDNLFQ